MTSKEINHATLIAFLARALNRAALTALDAEFGLRVQHVTIHDSGVIRVDLDGDHVVVVSAEHIVPRCVPVTSKGNAADARL